MEEVQVGAVLDELMRASRESEACFRAWAERTDSEEMRNLLLHRSRVCARNEAELQALETDLGEIVRDTADAPVDRNIGGPLGIATERGLFAACEAQDSRVLMRYRDALEYRLPASVHALVAQQFADLLDQHARLKRVHELKNHVPALPALALSPQSLTI